MRKEVQGAHGKGLALGLVADIVGVGGEVVDEDLRALGERLRRGGREGWAERVGSRAVRLERQGRPGRGRARERRGRLRRAPMKARSRHSEARLQRLLRDDDLALLLVANGCSSGERRARAGRGRCRQ